LLWQSQDGGGHGGHRRWWRRAAAVQIRLLPSLPFLSLPLPFSFATPQQEQQGLQRLHTAARRPAMVAGDEGWRRRRSALAGVRVPVRG